MTEFSVYNHIVSKYDNRLLIWARLAPEGRSTGSIIDHEVADMLR